jgi:transcription termination factor Rho
LDRPASASRTEKVLYEEFLKTEEAEKLPLSRENDEFFRAIDIEEEDTRSNVVGSHPD